jgi:AcrR family transcriptional regulator
MTVDKPVQDHTKTKRQIFAAAVREFSDKGFAGARMSSIARRSGVNQALIHYYYKNKEGLYRDILARLFGMEFDSDITQRIRAVELDFKLTPSQKLYAGIYILLNIHMELFNPDFSRIIMREIIDDRENIKEMIKKHLMPRYQILEAIIIDGIQRGEFETKNPLFVVMGLNTFIINYINTRALLDDCQAGNITCLENERNRVFEFLVDNTFKALRPGGKALNIPRIAPAAMKKIDNLIQKFNTEIKSERFHDDSR